MKYLVIPEEKIELERYQEKGADSFIFGLENYSVNYPEISLKEIEELSKKHSLWIALNKNIRNEELDNLEMILEELSSFPIEGVLFYDLSVLSIVQRKKLSLSLVWHQTHMVTNYQTCNYYFDKGVSYGIVSNEITLEEILEMKKHTKMKLMVQVFGYPVVSHSRRNLVTNYFKDIKKESEKDLYTLTEKNPDSLLIKESHAGTTILFGKPMNGTRVLYDLLEQGIEYAILDMRNLKEEIGIQILEIYQTIRKTFSTSSREEKEQIINQTVELVGDYTNFFYKKTIYKVKRGDSNEKRNN